MEVESSNAEETGEEGREMASMVGVVRRGELASSEMLEVEDSRREYSSEGQAGDEGRRWCEPREEVDDEDAERLSKEGGVRAGSSRGAKWRGMAKYDCAGMMLKYAPVEVCCKV